MFIDLPPNSPTQVPMVIVADASQTQKPATSIRTLGICVPMPNRPDDQSYLGREAIAFSASAANYLYDYEGKKVDYRDATVTLLQPPAHGELTEVVKGSASYKPTRGFAGQDKIVALVELGGYQVKVVYFIKVQPEGTGLIPDDEEVIKKYCGSKGAMWKISTTFTTPAQGNAALQNLVNAVSIDSRIAVDIADLSGNAVARNRYCAVCIHLGIKG